MSRDSLWFLIMRISSLNIFFFIGSLLRMGLSRNRLRSLKFRMSLGDPLKRHSSKSNSKSWELYWRFLRSEGVFCPIAPNTEMLQNSKILSKVASQLAHWEECAGTCLTTGALVGGKPLFVVSAIFCGVNIPWQPFLSNHCDIPELRFRTEKTCG